MEWQEYRGLYQLIMLLRFMGIVLAPVCFYFIVRNRNEQRIFYDRQGRTAMSNANAAGLVLAVAWFIWSAVYWFPRIAGRQ